MSRSTAVINLRLESGRTDVLKFDSRFGLSFLGEASFLGELFHVEIFLGEVFLGEVFLGEELFFFTGMFGVISMTADGARC